MKKINLILAASMLPLTVGANTVTDAFSGPYLGGSVGVNNLSSTQNLYFDPDKVANTGLYNFQQSVSKTFFLGQVYLGYGYLFSQKPIYIGLEALVDLSQPSLNINTGNFSLNLKQNNAYGGRVKLGYARQNSLLYLLLGLEGTSIKNNLAFRYGGLYNSGMMSLDNINGKSSSALITQLGVGLDIPYSESWTARLEYAHNFYNDNHYSINHRFITYNNPKGSYTASLEGDQVSVGVKYRWKQS